MVKQRASIDERIKNDCVTGISKAPVPHSIMGGDIMA